jgi:hypothetical protein
MLVYNITIKVHHTIANEWLVWQMEEHIPDVMASCQFKAYSFYKLLEQDEQEGPTYVVQYFAESKEQYMCYINQYADLLRKKAIDKWGDKFIAFRTIMESVC